MDNQAVIIFLIYGIIMLGVGFYIRPRVDDFLASVRVWLLRAFGPRAVSTKSRTTTKLPKTPEELEIKVLGTYNIDGHDFNVIIKPPIDDYKREFYDPGTTTRIGKNWSAREQVLIRDSIVQVKVVNGKITEGQWKCPYTGQVFTSPADIDVDHIVPLAEAWISGTKLWNQPKRSAFSRDLENLIAVAQSANQQKGMKGPDKWMPPLADIETRRWYIQCWIHTKKKYELGMSKEEILAMAKYAL